MLAVSGATIQAAGICSIGVSSSERVARSESDDTPVTTAISSTRISAPAMHRRSPRRPSRLRKTRTKVWCPEA